MHPSRGVAEEEIIRHCKTGSLKHQEMLYKRFYAYAVSICLRYCFNRDDAVEAVNDAFIKIFNSVSGYTDDRPFKPWLRTIIINAAIDRRRKEVKFQYADLEDADGFNYPATAIENLGVQDILKLMEQLPVVYQAVFNLHEVDGYSHDEIAKMLDLSTSASRVYLSRAKERLRNILTKEHING